MSFPKNYKMLIFFFFFLLSAYSLNLLYFMQLLVRLVYAQTFFLINYKQVYLLAFSIRREWQGSGNDREEGIEAVREREMWVCMCV